MERLSNPGMSSVPATSTTAVAAANRNCNESGTTSGVAGNTGGGVGGATKVEIKAEKQDDELVSR